MALNLVIGDKTYSSWSLRAALALELSGAPYTEQLVRLNQPDSRERILEHSPTGKVPLLKTDEGSIWDSLAISEYLAETYPEAHLWPRGAFARAIARSVCAEMHSSFVPLRVAMPMDLSRDEALPQVPADVLADIERTAPSGRIAGASSVRTGRICLVMSALPMRFSPRWPCAFAVTAWHFRPRRRPMLKPFTSGQPFSAGNRQHVRNSRRETSACGSSGYPQYRRAHFAGPSGRR